MDDNDNTPPTLPYARHDSGRKAREVRVFAAVILLIVIVLLFDWVLLFTAWMAGWL